MKAFNPKALPNFDALFAFDYTIEPGDGSGRAAHEVLTVRRRRDDAIAFRKTWVKGARLPIGIEDDVHVDYDVGDVEAMVKHWHGSREGAP
jgi:hypothetical protein